MRIGGGRGAGSVIVSVNARGSCNAPQFHEPLQYAFVCMRAHAVKPLITICDGHFVDTGLLWRYDGCLRYSWVYCRRFVVCGLVDSCWLLTVPTSSHCRSLLKTSWLTNASSSICRTCWVKVSNKGCTLVARAVTSTHPAVACKYAWWGSPLKQTMTQMFFLFALAPCE